MREETQAVAAATLSRRAHERRERRLRRMRRIGAGVTVCFFGCILLLMASLQLHRIPIKQIELEGNVHCSAQTLLEMLPVKVGDEIYRADVDAARAALLQACPYLREVQLERSLSGTIRIVIEERVARWALQHTAADGTVGYVLLDETLYALEYVNDANMTCIVIAEGLVLPQPGETLQKAAERAEEEYEAFLEEQQIEDAPLPTYVAEVTSLASYLAPVLESYSELDTQDAPACLDLREPYDKVLVLRDGSRYLLGGAAQLKEQIAYARAVATTYRQERGGVLATGALTVDVRDLSRVYVRESDVSP